jgi:hypothetical protein
MEVAGHVLRSSPIFFLTVSTYCPWTVVVLYTVRRAQCTLPPVFTVYTAPCVHNTILQRTYDPLFFWACETWPFSVSDLKENSGECLHWNLLPLKFFSCKYCLAPKSACVLLKAILWWFITLFSPAVLQRPGAGLFLTLFRFLERGFTCINHFYWLDKLYMFLSDGGQGFLLVVYAWMFVSYSLFHFYIG